MRYVIIHIMALGYGARWIWIVMAAYVAGIYATLPVMRSFLGVLYNYFGRGSVTMAVNVALVLMALAIGGVVLRRSFKRFFVIAVALAIMLAVAFSLHLPEERIHFIEYGVLGAMSLAAFGAGRWRIVAAIVFVVVVGAFDEFIQYLLPNRVGDIRDVMMNAGAGVIGVCAGWLLR